MMAAERGLKYGSLQKRFDLMVFAPGGKAWCLVECKAPDVPISSSTLLQAFTYNAELNASSVFITNGLTHFWYNIENGLPQLGELPPPLVGL